MCAFDPFRLDNVNQCLWRGNVRVDLKPKPFAVLQHLIAHADRLVTQDELLTAIWPDTYVQPEVLRQYIVEIRRALGDSAEAPRFVRTFPKRGYQFIAPISDRVASFSEDVEPTPTTLVGRGSVLTSLDRALKNAHGGRRQVVFVVGEAGIGKTSVIGAFQQVAADSPGVRVARGHSVEGFGGKEAYYPIFEAVGQLARGPAGTLLVNTLARQAPTWLIQFPSLVRPEQRAALQQEIVGATRERMVREFCEALEVMTETTTLVLLLEDLHWADHSTLDVMSAIARRREPARLLVVGTFRPADVIMSESPLKPLKQDLVLHHLASELTLERLHPSDVGEYLAATFVRSDLPEGLAAVIHRHSDGNPLFMTAMLDHLVQQRVLSEANGHWTMTVPLDEVDPGVPDTLGQMLEMQLRHVSDTERNVLACASVAGEHFTAWSVATMQSREPSDVEALCAHLANRQQFLKAQGTRTLSNGTVTPALAFRHALYREVLYRGLNPAERVSFHRRLAEGLEGLQSPVDPELGAELALHCEEGGHYNAAIRYLMLAAENASRRYAHREAIGALEHARQLLSKVGEERGQELDVAILERIGTAHLELGDMVQSAETYEAAAKCAGEHGLLAAQAHALMRLAHPAAAVDPDRCLAACERAVQLGAIMKDPVLEARARLLFAGWCILVDGWRREDAHSYAAALTDFRRLVNDVDPYEQTVYAWVQTFQSEYAEACESCQRALMKLTTAHGLWERAPALSAKAVALVYLGRLGEAHGTLTTGIELAQKNNNATWLGIFRGYFAWIRSQAYDFDGVRVMANHTVQSGMGEPTERVRLRMNLLRGFGDLAAGDHGRAVQCFEEVRDHQARSVLSWYWRVFATLGLSEASLALGNLEKASVEADTLMETVSAWEESFVKGLAWELRARIALARARQESAEQDILHGLEVVSAVEVPLAAWRVHATAWDVYRRTNAAKAEEHRSRAKTIILQIADSLVGASESLRQSFLSAEQVRRVLDEGSSTATTVARGGRRSRKRLPTP